MADDDKIIKSRPISIQAEFEVELGKKIIYDTLTSVNDYTKFMIGFNGVIAGLYSGLLKLVPQELIQNIHPAILFLPVLSFIITSIIFTLAYFPHMEKLSLNQPSSIMKAYEELTERKMKMSQIGTAGFIISILILAIFFILL